MTGGALSGLSLPTCVKGTGSVGASKSGGSTDGGFRYSGTRYPGGRCVGSGRGGGTISDCSEGSDWSRNCLGENLSGRSFGVSFFKRFCVVGAQAGRDVIHRAALRIPNQVR